MFLALFITYSGVQWWVCYYICTQIYKSIAILDRSLILTFMFYLILEFLFNIMTHRCMILEYNVLLQSIKIQDTSSILWNSLSWRRRASAHNRNPKMKTLSYIIESSNWKRCVSSCYLIFLHGCLLCNLNSVFLTYIEFIFMIHFS